MSIVIVIMLVMFGIRLAFLKLSIQNEKRILANGGKEYGVSNTKLITLLHILFYLMCIVEAIVYKVQLDSVGYLGLALMLFSLLVLWVVTRLLGEIWTVKLMLLKEHKFVDHWLFRVVKHPNYFLNIAPELLGILLLCHAKFAALILPFYAYAIYKRICEENWLLKEIIIPNGIKEK
ncbi:isoprenylcysteine carboxyl methyltransferase family protein [Streptococcus ruminantium]|uniref:isoprenylcysteine carboxyl methyltransferase family protein n=1 Tax=Streptococcus ruminantium TaxID=1917441 RepID=UPI0012DC54F0|nr:isoprenylcysteine carboxyl methyltransferase family protein [Streptococcus ruminantium]